MNKSLFYYVVAVLVTMSNISCSSSDEDDYNDGNQKVSLAEPEFANEAVAFEIADNSVVAASGDASLMGLNITESGKAIFKLKEADAIKYITYNVKVDGDTYIITDKNGNSMGTVKSSVMRSSGDTNLIINVKVGGYSFIVNAVTAKMLWDIMASSVNLENIARTWTIQSMLMTIEGEISATKEQQDGNLKALADEAQKRGAELTEEEMDAFNKTVAGITLDKTGLISIEYTDGNGEGCTWNWVDNAQTSFVLQLRDSDFGNKFLSNGSVISVKFYPSGVCHFVVTTNIVDKKNYKVTLRIVMK